MARCLVEPKANRVPIHLLNPSSETIRVPAKAVVASIESAESPLSECFAGVLEEDTPLSQEKAAMLEELARDSGAELSEEEKKKFLRLLVRYAGLFSDSKRDTGRTNRLTHEIHTGDAIPTRQAVRRLPPPRRKVVQGLLADMFEKDVIQPRTSEEKGWKLPILRGLQKAE